MRSAFIFSALAASAIGGVIPTNVASAVASLVQTSTASAASPTRSYVHFNCDTSLQSASDHFVSLITQLHDETSNSSIALSKRAVTQIQNIPLYIHVVTTTANSGMVTAAQVQQQAAALNSAYNANGISFQLKNVSWTVNDTWAIGASSADDMSMKKALRQGGYSALNLYLQSDLAGNVLGVCTLPTNVGTNPTPSSYTVDGCNIALGTVPNGPIGGYNMGKTAVHETGHWLGLLHTFEGYSCTGSGDFVTDTPMESTSTDGCPTSPWKNSCAGVRSGVDPIHNYMDYSTDACYTRFTPGQQTRMMQLWSQYRQGL